VTNGAHAHYFANGAAAKPTAAQHGSPFRPAAWSWEQTLIVGPENELVAEALGTLCEELGTSYNPLLICGAPGLGKSHIARGLAAHWQRKWGDPGAVLVLGGGEFAAIYAQAVERDQLRPFQTSLRQRRLLVIDDLTQLAGKRTALLELQYSFDELLANGGAMAFTSRMAPEMIHGMTAPLAARLQSGLFSTLHAPGAAVRLAMWERYTAAQGFAATENSLHALAHGIVLTAADIWQLAADLASQSPDGRTVMAEAARAALSSQRGGYKPSVKAIANLSAKYFSLKPAELFSPTRRRAVVTARNLAMYLARQLGEISLEQLGKHFGGRDHTTVLHGIRTIEQRIRTDPAIRQAHDDLRKLLAGG